MPIHILVKFILLSLNQRNDLLIITNLDAFKVNNAGLLEHNRLITSEGYAVFLFYHGTFKYSFGN